MSSFAEILVIALLTGLCCAIPGNFLVLRRMAMLTDAISHSVLLGIVLAFLWIGDLDSPLLILGATLMGIATVWCVETLYKSKLLEADAAIGITFPLLFSIAVILVTQYAGNVHLDTDSILLGELAFAPFDRLVVNGIDYGAKAIFVNGFVLLLVIFLITLFYKELSFVTFDPTIAKLAGFSPILIHYGLMGLVSLTSVAAFQSIGSILVIAFMITPAITAALWTRTLKTRILLSCLITSVSVVLGVVLAIYIDTSLAGMMASLLGLFFVISLIIAPKQGFIDMLRRRSKQRFAFGRETMLQHLIIHYNTDLETEENKITALPVHLKWPEQFTQEIYKSLLLDGYVEEVEGRLVPTKPGLAHNMYYRENLHD